MYAHRTKTRTLNIFKKPTLEENINLSGFNYVDTFLCVLLSLSYFRRNTDFHMINQSDGTAVSSNSSYKKQS